MHEWATICVALALLLASHAEAFWRMNCALIQRGRIDPLVSPGAISGHAHSILGGSNIGINASFNSLFNSQCTSCEITADKSAYWSPTLYYQYPNGSVLSVPNDGGVAYYLGRGPNTNQTIPFPNGLNILSGNMAARSYDNTTMTWGNATYPGRPIADRVTFACLKDNQPPEQHYMFDTDCPYGMRAQIHYQSCWNGRDLYKADNSHVAYQSQIDNGVCPPTHPIQLPHIFLEVLYGVANVPKQAGGRFVFAQGDPTGYGFHGDFQNGWDYDVLQQAVTDCLSVENFGTISECAILQRYQTSGYPYNCPERPRQIGEHVVGLLAQLPGCNQVTNGPDAAPMSSNRCAPGTPQPSVTTTVDSTTLPTAQVAPGAAWSENSQQKYVGCYADNVNSVRALNAQFMSNKSIMSVDYCMSWCKSKGYRLSGTEYGTECHCDNVINPAYNTTIDGCTWDCGATLAQGGTQQICGGLNAISIYNNTDPAFVLPRIKSPIGKYTQKNCLTDPDGSGGRALTGYRIVSNSMTADMCIKACLGRRYKYAGIEYGTECYCGNSISSTSGAKAQSCPVSSLMTCPGDAKQFCGAGSLLNLYYSATL